MRRIEEHFGLLLTAINYRDQNTSLLLMKEATLSCSELLLWLDCLNSQFPNALANELLIGARASMLESVAYIGLGLGRASISAIRTQIDLILAFTYFCEHPREWELVKTTDSGFKLKSHINQYHIETKPHFHRKLQIVEKSEGNSLSKLYRILSAHVHGQSPLTAPKSGQFVDLLSSDSFLSSLIELQKMVDRCLSNYLSIVYLEMNLSPPLEIENRIKSQLQSKEIKAVFFGD